MFQSCLVLFVNSLISLFYSSYFLLTLKESNKENLSDWRSQAGAPEPSRRRARRSQTITYAMPYARYTNHPATGMA